MCLFTKLCAENIEEKDTGKKFLMVITDVNNLCLSFWKFHVTAVSCVTKWKTNLGDSTHRRKKLKSSE